MLDWPLCRVLLMKDANYPWLILVPRRADISEVYQLEKDERGTLIEEIAEAARRLQSLTGADKMNVGALGNMVPQLHVHVIARFIGDPAWPGPVWGAVAAVEYGKDDLAGRVAALRQALA
ncbi:MAG: HIT domain-containing protein [Solirubrobacterales bacterium]